MSWLTWILLESKLALAIPLGTTLFALLVHWRRGGNPRPLLVGLAASIILFTLQTLVVTKREHAGQTLDAIAADLIAGRTTALQAALAPSFQTDNLDRDAFLRFVADRLRQTDILWARRTRLHIEPSAADRFTAIAAYTAEIQVAGIPMHFPSTWAITFQRVIDDWQITDIRCRALDEARNLSWRDIAASTRQFHQ